MIENLSINTYKKLGTQEFTFSPGLNVLRGPNWSGKSSLISAIKFALQGIQGVADSKDDLPTWNSKGKLSVTLDLPEHQITRSLNDCNVYYQTPEKPAATGHTACNSYLDELFGVSVANYNMLHFSDQGETAGLLTIGTAALQKMVEKIADVTLIDQVITLASTDLSVFKGKVEGKHIEDTTAYKESMANSQTNLDAAVLRVNGITSDITKLQVRESELATKIKQADEKIYAVDQAKKSLQVAELSRSKLATKMEMLEPSLVTVPVPAGNYAEEIKVLEADIKVSSDTLASGVKANKRHGEISTWLTNQSETALATELVWLKNISEVETGIEGLVIQEASHVSVDMARKLETVKLNEALDSSVCANCHRPFDSTDSHLEQTKARLIVLEDESKGYGVLIGGVRELLRTSREKLRNLRNTPPATVSVKSAIASLECELKTLSTQTISEGQVTTLEDMLDNMNAELLSLNVDKKNATEKLAAYQLAKSAYDLAGKEIEEVNEIIGVCKKSITATDELEAELKSLKLKREAVTPTLAQCLADLKALQGVELPNLKSGLAMATRAYIAGEKANESLRADRLQMKKTKNLVEYLRGSRSRFLQSIWDRILGYASTFCKTCTGGEVEAIVRDDKGKFKFVTDDVARPVTSASGAMRAFMGVGVRLGLAKALYGDSSFMVLDEPSADMSVENSTKLVSALMGTGMQIIYSTHSDLEELAAGNVIDLGEL